MKKVNFLALPVTDIEGNKTPQDWRIVVGKTLFQLAEDPDEDALSKKIYRSEGEIDLSDPEVAIIKKYIRCFKYFLQTAILDALQ